MATELPPEVEKKLELCRQRTAEMTAAVDALSQSVDDLMVELEDGGAVVTREMLEEPSFVRHVEDLRDTARRVKRDSQEPHTIRAGAAGRR